MLTKVYRRAVDARDVTLHGATHHFLVDDVLLLEFFLQDDHLLAHFFKFVVHLFTGFNGFTFVSIVL